MGNEWRRLDDFDIARLELAGLALLSSLAFTSSSAAFAAFRCLQGIRFSTDCLPVVLCCTRWVVAKEPIPSFCKRV